MLQDVCWETFLGPGWSKGPRWESQVLGGILSRKHTHYSGGGGRCATPHLCFTKSHKLFKLELPVPQREITTELIQIHLDLTPHLVIFEARNSHWPGASPQWMFSCLMRLHCQSFRRYKSANQSVSLPCRGNLQSELNMFQQQVQELLALETGASSLQSPTVKSRFKMNAIDAIVEALSVCTCRINTRSMITRGSEFSLPRANSTDHVPTSGCKHCWSSSAFGHCKL